MIVQPKPFLHFSLFPVFKQFFCIHTAFFNERKLWHIFSTFKWFDSLSIDMIYLQYHIIFHINTSYSTNDLTQCFHYHTKNWPNMQKMIKTISEDNHRPHERYAFLFLLYLQCHCNAWYITFWLLPWMSAFLFLQTIFYRRYTIKADFTAFYYANNLYF